MRRMFGNAFQSNTTSPTNNSHSTTNYQTDPLRSSQVDFSPSNSRSQSINSDPFGSLDDVFSPERLPFGSSQAGSFSNSPSHTRFPNTHEPASKTIRLDQRNRSDSATSFSDSSRGPARSPSTKHVLLGPDLKSKMMLELLSGQALVEASSFQILSFNRVQQLKKCTHSDFPTPSLSNQDQMKLENRLTSISNNLVLEKKIHDATLTLAESDVNQNDSNLEHSNQRLEQLRDEKARIQSELSEISTKLLQHLSATLSLSLKKLEQNQPSDYSSSFGQSPTRSASNHRQADQHRSPSPSLTDASRCTILSSDRFDGPHLFANNRHGLDHHQASHPSPRSASNLTLDTGQLLQYEKTIAQQTSDLEQLRAELANLRQQSVLAETNRTSNQANDLKRVERELKLENERVRHQTDQTHTQELDRLRREVDSLAADLERERSQLSGDKQAFSTRTSDAEARARAAEASQRQLEADVDRLRSELETAEEAKDSVRIELAALQAAVTRLADQKADSERQYQTLAEQLSSKESERREAIAQLDNFRSMVEKLEAENITLNKSVEDLKAQSDQQAEEKAKDDIDEPLSNHSAEWEKLLEKFSGVSTQVTLTNASFAQFLRGAPSQISMEGRMEWMNELIGHLENHLKIITTQHESTLETERQSHEQASQAQMDERTILSTQVAELETKLFELQSSHTPAATTTSSELETVTQQLAAAEKRIEEATTSANVVEKALRELFKSLPANAETRARLEHDADLGAFRLGYEAQPTKKSGLGGLFGLGKRAATPVEEGSEYTFDSFLERIKLLNESDKKLVDRLIKYEIEKDSYKNNATRAQKLAEECQAALKTYQSQVKELEERLEYADTQSATMLDRFNDLMESEEKAHALAKRSEAYTTQIANLNQQIENLKKELEEREDEIESMKKSEVKARHRFEDLEGEMSSLKLKLKQVERQ
ncbi:uncharacterized protein MELLADRAFT_78169 [Melampsora larici-populina 98AG31]|uniref:Up-regulated during septation protein 1 domain-containing protein n=1 Tax=Melampsora larici-populina (strain 98AG31 / pathotype 3-4-7) TaxID=747676 RepID=F4RR16_MELLP|nr:uncharacterized protein MELLADRAFT_78169 [Melampsora larici-populina 98AG31]EGG05222.1 hypothetical protein MELLADRAFT_78169 [Melampsora larici-populina 98AG31]